MLGISQVNNTVKILHAREYQIISTFVLCLLLHWLDRLVTNTEVPRGSFSLNCHVDYDWGKLTLKTTS